MLNFKRRIATAIGIILLLNSGQTINAQSYNTMIWGDLGAGDNFAWSVSAADPMNFAVGTIYDANNRGSAKVYTYDGNSWVQKGSTIYGPIGSDGNAGYAVAMPHKNTLAVGAPGYSPSSSLNAAGLVRVYSWNGNDWVQRGSDLTGESFIDLFGSSISMPDTNTIAIGAPKNDGTGTGSSIDRDYGHVRVYIWSGTDWVQKGLDIDGENAFDLSGTSVSMPNANTVAIGAPQNKGNGPGAINNQYYGHVRVFSWNGSSWVQQGNDIDGTKNGQKKGTSVAMADSVTMVVGSPGWSSNTYTSVGKATTYKWNGNSWIQFGNSIVGTQGYGLVGTSVCFPSPNTIGIGSPAVGSGVNDGKAEIFEYDDQSNSWQIQHSTFGGAIAGSEYLGYCIDMPTEDVLVTGAPWAGSGTLNGINIPVDNGYVKIKNFGPAYLSANNRGCLECDLLSIGETFFYEGELYTVVDRAMLDNMIDNGDNIERVCVSHITDMKNLLRGERTFNQDISTWDVSNVLTMSGMFFNAEDFNQSIGNWEVDAVTNFAQMFQNAESFNQKLNGWNVSQATVMSRMFKGATLFDNPLNRWDVSNVTRMTSMFEGASSFDRDISSWCVTHFTFNAPPNFALNSALQQQHYPLWGNCQRPFDNVLALATGASINSDDCIDCSQLNVGDFFVIGGDTMVVADRNMLDDLVDDRKDLSKVCVSHVTNMRDVLRGEIWFNTDIGRWDVSNVTDMANMFKNAKNFNQDLNNWNVSQVTNMSRIFNKAKLFNGKINSWDVSNVRRFNASFRGAEVFDQNIGHWDVSGAWAMNDMFRSADDFNRDLTRWCVSNIAAAPANFSTNSGLAIFNEPIWGTCGVSWNQVHNDLLGSTNGDNYGHAISMPLTNILAVGAPKNDDGGADAGQVSVLQYNGTNWSLIGSEIDGAAAGDQFGSAISMINSNVLAIGAPLNDDAGSDAGMVGVYSWNGTTWGKVGSDIEGENAGDKCGFAVSMGDPSTLAIGAPYNSNSGTDAGQVRVFSLNGNTWSQLGIDIEGSTGDRLGYAVSMANASTLAIGMPFSDVNGTNSGKAIVLVWNGSNWIQKGSDIDGISPGELFGKSIDMATINTVAIGAPSASNDKGAVRIYSWDGTDWVQKGSDIEGLAASNFCGHSVSMGSENTIAVGAYKNALNGSASGHTRVFAWNGAEWVLEANVLNADGPEEYGGWSVDMPNSTTVAFGAPGTGLSGIENGYVRVFSLGAQAASNSIIRESFNDADGNEELGNTTAITESSLLPNPTNDSFALKPKRDGTFVIRNVQGQIVDEGIIPNVFDVSEIPAGMYYLELKFNEIRQNISFIKL